MNEFSPFMYQEDELVSPTAKANASEWRLLRRLHLPKRFNDPSSAGIFKRAVVVDVEATGLSTETDDVIQLAILPFDYDAETGRILTVHSDQAFEALREPSVPITEEASLITGITDKMVAGKTIDAPVIDKLVSDSSLIIAHNARFYRPMVERHWECFAEKPWACTSDGVDWLREGFSAGKLDYLGMQYGWFYDGHRALADCEACLALLAQALPKSGTQVMTRVREHALKEEFLIPAYGSPLDSKEKLKERNYRWRPANLPNGKVWWTTTTDPDTEIAWLREEIYGRDVKIEAHPITALNRYSDRIWSFE
jgi:DNA polymerase-3 subunit epsilon